EVGSSPGSTDLCALTPKLKGRGRPLRLGPASALSSARRATVSLGAGDGGGALRDPDVSRVMSRPNHPEGGSRPRATSASPEFGPPFAGMFRVLRVWGRPAQRGRPRSEIL